MKRVIRSQHILSLSLFVCLTLGHVVSAFGQQSSCGRLLGHPDLPGAQFLHQKTPQLHTARQVEKRANPPGQDRAQRLMNPAEKLVAWLDSWEQSVAAYGNKPRDKRRIIDFFLNLHVTKASEVPESFFEHQQQVARELGHGEIKMTKAWRDQIVGTAIADQRKSLEIWLDYFLSPDSSSYPMWTKYWALSAVVKMGKFDPKAETFGVRARGQMAPFPDLNREAFAMVIDVIVKKVGGKSLDEFVKQEYAEELNEADTEEIKQAAIKRAEHCKQLLLGAKFEKLYGRALKLATASLQDLSNTEGKWVKYDQGSDHIPLFKSIQGMNTGWCTAGEATAKQQLAEGDFHVFYSKDKLGRARVPRIAIRMQGGRIAEIRGIGESQNLDSGISESSALSEKLKEFGNEGKVYFKKVSDMKRLTEIETKQKQKVELSDSDLRFLYELDGPIEGFGYNKDPRVKKIMHGRANIRGDLAKLFACRPEEISLTREEALSGGIQYHHGNLNLRNLPSTEGLTLPKLVGGDLDLGSLLSAKGLTLPRAVGGNLDLSGLLSAKGLTLPDSVGGLLKLRSLMSAEGLLLPQSMGGGLDLVGLRSAEGLTLPHTMRGSLYLSGLQSAAGLVLPRSVGGDLYLRELKSAVGLTLPQSVGGSLDISSLLTAAGLLLPQSVGGDLSLGCLLSAERMIFPESVGGDLYLASLRFAKGLTLPKSVGGNLDLSELQSAEGLTLPKSVRGKLLLGGLQLAGGLTLPESVGGEIFVPKWLRATLSDQIRAAKKSSAP